MTASAHAAGLYPRFRSKIDLRLAATHLFGIVVSGTVAIGLLLQKGLASLAVIPLLATGLLLWLLIDTSYRVTETDVIVHSGPFRTAVPIASICAVRATRTVHSAPALSLDRLELVHAGGALVISPADKAGFIRALRERQAVLGGATRGALSVSVLVRLPEPVARVGDDERTVGRG
jgi:hypothetical protein